jgi:hypothetical protein
MQPIPGAMQGLEVRTIHIQELTMTIPDTTIRIQNIPIPIVGMDIDINTINFTIA